MDAPAVSVEVHLAKGLPSFTIKGNNLPFSNVAHTDDEVSQRYYVHNLPVVRLAEHRSEFNMRSQPTLDETRVISQLKFALESIFDNVEQDASITDRPDSLFIIDGCRVACELRSITPERVLALHGLKLETDEVTQLAFPIEPHIWVSNAVLAKADRVAEYQRRADANEVWLILHGTSGPMGWELFTWQKVDSLKVLFEIGAQRFDHPFHRIIVVSDEGNTLEIYNRATSEARNVSMNLKHLG
jgi:hypothetical protein